VRTADLDYELPPSLIAQEPVEPRSRARLLVYERSRRDIRHLRFDALLDQLDPSDLIVANDTRVLPVRIRAHRRSGGAVELLLLEPLGDGAWLALARPYARLKPGERVLVGQSYEFCVDERLGEGRVRVTPPAGVSLEALLSELGEMPLPPYIHHSLADPNRYQTVYATHAGSAAAPTAGLHFTDALWAAVRARHEVATVTLGVGLDTFRPVSEAELEQHHIHTERYSVSTEAAAQITAARREGRRVVAVGTTSVRVLETVFGSPDSAPAAPLNGRTSIFITPGYRFHAVGAMITNFHLPRSTLLALVMAFAGVDETRALYRAAIEHRYRFYSFGDATLIL
jgi:S-adenosylmethionine:tRNA ribosyltransferase-isomerase